MKKRRKQHEAWGSRVPEQRGIEHDSLDAVTFLLTELGIDVDALLRATADVPKESGKP